jgi:hypothetical protein
MTRSALVLLGLTLALGAAVAAAAQTATADATPAPEPTPKPPAAEPFAFADFSGTPYFTYNAGDKFKAWDMQVTTDFYPRPFVIFRLEYNYRHANVPYFSGRAA